MEENNNNKKNQEVEGSENITIEQAKEIISSEQFKQIATMTVCAWLGFVIVPSMFSALGSGMNGLIYVIKGSFAIIGSLLPFLAIGVLWTIFFPNKTKDITKDVTKDATKDVTKDITKDEF